VFLGQVLIPDSSVAAKWSRFQRLKSGSGGRMQSGYCRMASLKPEILLL